RRSIALIKLNPDLFKIKSPYFLDLSPRAQQIFALNRCLMAVIYSIDHSVIYKKTLSKEKLYDWSQVFDPTPLKYYIILLDKEIAVYRCFYNIGYRKFFNVRMQWIYIIVIFAWQ